MIMFGFVSVDNTSDLFEEDLPGYCLVIRYFEEVLQVYLRQLISFASMTLNLRRRMWRPKPSLVDNQGAQCSFTPLSLAR